MYIRQVQGMLKISEENLFDSGMRIVIFTFQLLEFNF